MGYSVVFYESGVTNDNEATSIFIKVKDHKCSIMLWLFTLSYFHVVSTKYMKNKRTIFFCGTTVQLWPMLFYS